MKFGFRIAVMAALMIIAAPQVEAFSKEAVDHSGFVSVDGNTAVFTLDLMMGGFKKDIYVPVVGERDVAYGTRGNTFGYQIERGFPEGVSEDGVTQVLAVSKAKIVDGMYRIPARTLVPFSFIGVMSVSPDESNIYRLRVNELPFFIGEDKSPRNFSDGELQYMVTNYEALNYEQDPG